MSALALLLAVSRTPQDAALEAARDHWTGHGHEILAEFVELLELPCVAGDDAGIARNVAWIQAAFARRGVRLDALELDGASPLLTGRLDAPGTDRTLGVYIHYDGQPVDPRAWTFGPWAPTLTTRALEDGGERRPLPGPDEAIDPEWRVYARAAGDDKAPVIAWLAALDALEAAGLAPTVDLLFLFDGEEEAGSVNLPRYLTRHAERFHPDVWLFCDGPVHQSRRPQLCFGVRGISGMELAVYGAARPLHSGHYGGYVPNPAERLSRLLGSMKDDRGRVLIAGFDDSTQPPSAATRAALDALPALDGPLRHELHLPPANEDDEGYFASLMRPSLNLRGVLSGNVGAKARNVIPNHAMASLDIRLAAGNDPRAMAGLVADHIESQGYHLVTRAPDADTLRAHGKVARLTWQGGYPAVRTELDEPAAQPVIAAARRAAGAELLLVPTLGGSLPLYLFDEPLVIVPIANHDDNQHAPDENLRLANLAYGIELFAAIATSR